MDLPSATTIDRLVTAYKSARDSVRNEKTALKSCQDDLSACLDAQQLIQETARNAQEYAHKRISSIVSRCLSAVYGDDAYAFRIRFQKARGKTEARIVFERSGHVYERPLAQCSGGQCHLAAFASRLACLMLSVPRKRLLMVLDEPFVGIDRERIALVAELLNTLHKEFGVQFVLTSAHAMTFDTGKVIQF